MASVPVTVAQCYQYVVGIDTHAATHTLAVLGANGALIDQGTFPTSPAGLARAIDWIGRRTAGEVDSVRVSAEGTGSYGLVNFSVEVGLVVAVGVDALGVGYGEVLQGWCRAGGVVDRVE